VAVPVAAEAAFGVELLERAAAGVAIGGGHSIDDPEPKYGMTVSGVVHPDEMLTAAGARPGDEIYLTKPVGGG
jgi:selenide,water dikinase